MQPVKQSYIKFKVDLQDTLRKFVCIKPDSCLAVDDLIERLYDTFPGDTTHENTSTETDIGKLKEQIKFLEAKCKSWENSHASYVTSSEQYLFRLERFISSDRDFQFYASFPDYETFKFFSITCLQHAII